MNFPTHALAPGTVITFLRGTQFEFHMLLCAFLPFFWTIWKPSAIQKIVKSNIWISHGGKVIDVGLRLDDVHSPETLISTCKSIQRYNPEGRHRQF
jgi:hypothetical protein